MIIQSFRARNLYKYSRLELKDIPARSMIGIAGPNESGKSAIAESICLGLFGRTFSVPADRLEKIIKWGEQDAEVQLHFLGSDSIPYRAIRMISADGAHSARLERLDTGETIAQGMDAVDLAVTQVIGFDFDQYVEAFYLAQKEFAALHPQSQMLRELLGIAHLDEVAQGLQREMDDDATIIESAERNIEDCQSRLDELSIDEDRLATLTADRDTLTTDLSSAREEKRNESSRRDDIEAALDEVESAIALTLDVTDETPPDSQQTARHRLDGAIAALAAAGEDDDLPEDFNLSDLRTWAADYGERLDSEAAIHRDAMHYGDGLRSWVGAPQSDEPPGNTPNGENGDTDGAGDSPLGTEESSTSSDADTGSAEKADATGPESGYETEKAGLNERCSVLQRRRSGNTRLLLIFAILGAVGGAAWWFLAQQPDSPMGERLGAWVASVPQFSEGFTAQQLNILAAGAGVLLFLAIIMMFRGGSLGRQVLDGRIALAELERKRKKVQQELGILDGLGAGTIRERMNLIAELDDEALHKQATGFVEGPGHVLCDAESFERFLEPLAESGERLSAARPEFSAQWDRDLASLTSRLEELESSRAEIDELISDEEARRGEASDLLTRMEAARSSIDDPNHRIRVRERALEQIEGTVHRIYSHFNTQIRDYLQRLVPLITDGRYQHMKIAGNFAMEVFSTDKNDFVDLEDLSSGTQRQILLAVRLALSQALADARDVSGQALILDEPFAFFDRERMDQTLLTLSGFSDEMTQIWVISQEFSAHAPFDKLLECARDKTELSLDT
ncbi:MAG: AAA family ATPase [Gammaproteobacteria bacterium]